MIHLSIWALIILARVEHVLMERFTINRQALGARIADRPHAITGGHMHHIKRRPRHMFCQAHDATEGKVFRKCIMYLRHILKPCAVFAEDLGVHMHDNVIVFGVNHAKPALAR